MTLLAVIEIFRTDETDDAVDQSGSKARATRVSARLAGLLIDAMMGIGRQRGALPGLEIHDVVTGRAAPERPAGLVRPRASSAEVDTETAIGGLRPRDRLEHQIDRQALFDQFERGRDVSQHAALGRNLEPRNEFVEQSQAVRRSPPDRRLAGLMPIQASPDPSSRPSRIEAVMPLASSKG